MALIVLTLLGLGRPSFPEGNVEPCPQRFTTSPYMTFVSMTSNWLGGFNASGMSSQNLCQLQQRRILIEKFLIFYYFWPEASL